MNRLAIALSALLFVAGAASAQDDEDKKPAKAQFDDVAQKAWDKWQKLEYHPGRDGVKQTAFKLKATIESAQLPAPMSATGEYAFDVSKKPQGTLTWSDPRVGALVGRQGWGVKGFDGLHDASDDLEDLAGCKLTGKVQEDKSVVVTITGHKKNITGFTFDAKGVMVGATIKAAGQTIDFKMKHKEVDGKYHKAGWSYTVKQGGATISSTVAMTDTKVGSHYIFKSVTETISRDGQTLATVKVEASDHSVNKPAPTSKPSK